MKINNKSKYIFDYWKPDWRLGLMWIITYVGLITYVNLRTATYISIVTLLGGWTISFSKPIKKSAYNGD